MMQSDASHPAPDQPTPEVPRGSLVDRWRRWPVLAGGVAVVIVLAGAAAVWLAHGAGAGGRTDHWERPVRGHFDHSGLFPAPFASPQAVTQACLGCHPAAGPEVLQTSHWLWLGPESIPPGRTQPVRLGKRNLINNFCISAIGNERSCSQCHVGYGWADRSFDFTRVENIDCLACHDRTGDYVKGDLGLPEPSVDLLAVARSVGTPTREACATCHAYGGGGLGVKHGDLDTSLVLPTEQDDVHMGRLDLLCVDCHRTNRHVIRGRGFSVSVEGRNAVSCRDCHPRPDHRDPRIDRHLAAVACQTCHIGSFARQQPTKTHWDWSRAGDPTRPDDEHHYLKIKGEFRYAMDLVPEYRWFNLSVDRYLLGDLVVVGGVTPINRPRGRIDDPGAQIWPFKIHRAWQPYDTVHRTLLTPVTGGPGGYWTTFDWDRSFRLGAEASGQPYSGQYGFTETEMYWPISHMVTPREQALGCIDCHGEGSRLDWPALGYRADPLELGGRR